jgi:gliding motility-associated-like protein
MKHIFAILLLTLSLKAFSQCSPVIDLPFNGNANDVSGNANHGTASGTPTLVPNRFGTANSAYRFGGVGDADYFTVAHTSSMNLSNKLSVSFWFRQCDFTGMDGWGATVARGYHITWAKKGDGISVLAGLHNFLTSNVTGTMFNSLSNCNGSGYGSFTPNFSNSVAFNCFDTCEWIHVVQVIDSNKQRFYFNGVLQQEFTISVANFSTANTHSLLIGKMDGTWYPFRGDIDEFKYYTCAINQTTINSLYNGYTDSKQANNIIRLDSTKVQMTTCTNQSLTLYANTVAGPFQYSKDSGTTWQTSNVFTGLTPNIYKISIKSSCNRKDTTIIVQPCCSQDFSWTTWTNFNSNSATGNITGGINVNMSANYSFSSTPTIFNYAMFNGLYNIPNTTCPRTEWSASSGIGVTTFCFNQFVDNPVLLLASLGSPGTPVTLKFSRPYIVEYDGGANVFVNDTTIIGNEGYSIIQFPGKLNCITVYSATPEIYTNITFGLNIPKFPVTMIGDTASCDTAKLKIVGGKSYKWTKGLYPDSSINYFTTSGLANLTVTDSIGCKVYRAYNIVIKSDKTSIFSQTICQGDSFAGKKTTGTYIDTFTSSNGCDSIRTLNLTVDPRTTSTISQTICQGDSFLGRKISGTFIDTLKNSDSKGCDSIRTLNLTVNPPTTSTINKSICPGDSFLGRKLAGTYIDSLKNANSKGCDSIRTLNLTMSGTKFYSFSIVRCQGQFYFFKGANRFNSGIYRDTIKIGSGCDSIAELNLTIQSPMALSSDTSSCDSFSFKSKKYYTNKVLRDTIKSNFGCDSVYKMINLSIFKPTKGQNDSIVACEKAMYQGSIFYRDTSFSENISKTIFPFCDSIIKLTKIKIHALPIVKIYALPDTFIKYGEKITLRASGGQSYLWNYNSSNQAIIESIITDKTYFEVKVTDNNLCEKIVGQWIYVNPEVEIIDVFSPNADGRNDNFAPYFKGDVSVLSFKIYNRWGQIIYQTSDQNPSWDGRFKGEIQPQGSYVYMLEYLAKGQKFSKTGAITLIH